MNRIMTKHSIFAAILLSLGMFAFSCNKVESSIQTPEKAINNAQPVEMTFTSTVAAKDATKSVAADGATAWVADEQITVYYQKTDDSFATATATVGTPNGDGSAPISATLTNAKNGSTVKFVYPAALADASGDLDASKLAAQHGTIADISANFDAATGSGTLVTDGTTCGTSAQISMVNQVLIGKFTPKYGGSAIDKITSLTISDGTNTYTVTPSSGTFGTEGIYVAMLPVDSKEVTINAATASENYTFSKADITLASGKLYSSLEIPMSQLFLINNSTADALRNTLNSAASGDIIEMAAGTYVESNTNYIAFTGKDVTVRAAKGATVTIQPQVSITISQGGKATFVGVIFDVSRLNELASWYEHLIYAADNNASNSLALENCEIKNFLLNNSAIFCSKTNKFASVSFNNCYFHDIKKSVFFAEEPDGSVSPVGSFSLTNSTIANITTDAGSYYAGIFDPRGASVNVIVDHCTFYNCECMNTDYGAIKVKNSSTAVVSNCIFVMPASYAGGRAVYNTGGTVNNCLTYNYTKDSTPHGIHSGPAISNCIESNPLFANAASSDFTLGATSPARTAGAGSTPIGDPRWYN